MYRVPYEMAAKLQEVIKYAIFHDKCHVSMNVILSWKWR